jgi:hypothetical protein
LAAAVRLMPGDPARRGPQVKWNEVSPENGGENLG